MARRWPCCAMLEASGGGIWGRASDLRIGGWGRGGDECLNTLAPSPRNIFNRAPNSPALPDLLTACHVHSYADTYTV